MFFYAAKVVWALAVPSTFLMLAAGAGLGLATLSRQARAAGLWLAGGAVAAALAIGLGPFGDLLMGPLEDRFPAYRDDGRLVAGIIALGGGIYTEISGARDQLSLGEANERLTYMAALARRHPEATLVFAGGSGGLVFEDLSEAETVRRFGGVVGLDTAAIRYDGASRNTFENAVNARKLIEPKPGERWLLVTSARHMPRAVGCFRQAGIDVTAFPVDYLTRGDGGWTTQPSLAIGLLRFDDAVREWIGLAAYRLSGRIASLFPAPSSSAGPMR